MRMMIIIIIIIIIITIIIIYIVRLFSSMQTVFAVHRLNNLSFWFTVEISFSCTYFMADSTKKRNFCPQYMHIKEVPQRSLLVSCCYYYYRYY